MNLLPFAPKFDDLPQTLPVFPLPGVLLLPGGHLPLNIFEPRYKAMVEDALGSDRLIGMVQPLKEDGKELQDTGCAGKITDFSETTDGRFLVSLNGVCRFGIREELSATTPYRRIRPYWGPYKKDLTEDAGVHLDRIKLKEALKIFFTMHDLDCEWKKIEEAPEEKLITCLSMVCPFEPEEKQALLEAKTSQGRADLFMDLLEFYIRSGTSSESLSKTQH